MNWTNFKTDVSIFLSMGRPSKHTAHPLFKLRESLGDRGVITQSQLAKYLDMPVNSLQVIEAGRRGGGRMPSWLLSKLKLHIGVVWNVQKEQWLFDLRLLGNPVLPGQEWVPISEWLRAAYQTKLKTPAGRSDNRDLAVFLFKAWIEELDRLVPDRLWLQLAERISAFVEQSVRELELGDSAKFFHKVSENNRDVLDAMNKLSMKGLTGRELIRKGLGDMPLGLALIGTDSEAGKAGIQEMNEASAILKDLPPETKKRKKSRQS